MNITGNQLEVNGINPYNPSLIYIVNVDFTLPDIDKGELVFITYSGQIAESYPPCLLDVTQIDTLETIFQHTVYRSPYE